LRGRQSWQLLDNAYALLRRFWILGTSPTGFMARPFSSNLGDAFLPDIQFRQEDQIVAETELKEYVVSSVVVPPSHRRYTR
jgi:hypothetical protein